MTRNPTRRSTWQRLWLTVAACALGGALGVASDAAAAGKPQAKRAVGGAGLDALAPAMISPDDLRPGMKGFGLSVMRGTKIERFDIEIIGVLRKALPQQDLVLIRCAGLGLEHSGIVAGMSGSPVYVEDATHGARLVGALSYGFAFNKDPVAGVTPIGAMLPELDRKLKPLPETQRLIADADVRSANVRVPQFGDVTMRPVAVPFAVAGLHPDAVAALNTAMEPLGLTAMAATTGGSATTRPTAPFEPGSAISLTLARGDVSISGVGTVTWVRGDQYLAFGHPFKGLGQVHLPVGGADVQWILASQQNSFKMAVPTADIGVLDQDRQPAIAGRIGPRAAMIPVHVQVQAPDTGETRHWNAEVVDQPLFFSLATAAVVGNAVRISEPVAVDASVKMRLEFQLEGGYAPIVYEDHLIGLSGTAQMGDVQSKTAAIAKALGHNGFKRVRVSRVEASFVVEESRALGFLESIRVPSTEVDVGEAVELEVSFLRPNSTNEVIRLKLPPIPRELAGEKIEVKVGPEQGMAPERPEPAHIEDILDYLRGQIPRNRLAAVIELPSKSLMFRGQRLTDLPAGVLDEVSGHARDSQAGKSTLRVTQDLPWAIEGKASVRLAVRAAR